MTTRKAPLAHLVEDEASHFPYKLDTALAVVAEDAPAGPGGPDDDRARTGDFLDEAIARASRDYIEAQAAHFTTGDADTFDAMQAAAERLVEARRVHRVGRGDGPTVTAIRAPRATGE